MGFYIWGEWEDAVTWQESNYPR